MLTDTNKQLVRRLYDDYLNPDHLDRLDEIVGPDYVGANGARGPDAFAETMKVLRAGFPDIVYTLDDLVGEGDRVAVRWTWRGTHTGAFRSFAATGKSVASSGFAIFVVTAGKITRATVETDRLGFLISVGAIPYDPAFGPPPSTR